MEATYTTEGIILNRQAWRESDSRLTIYTRQAGKLQLVARGLQKSQSKLSGHLEPLNRSSLMIVNGRAFSYVGAARSLDCFYHLKQDLDKLLCVRSWLAIFNRQVGESQADPKLYALLSASLHFFNRIKASPLYYQTLTNLFHIKLQILLGSGLDWQALSTNFPANQLAELRLILDRLHQGPPHLTKSQAKLLNHLVLTLDS
jgi:DNA repair protein RecO (recombination protein O)